CCMAMLLTPCGVASIEVATRYWVANDSATAPSSLEIIDTVKLSTPSENIVPMPYQSHFWNIDLVCSKPRHRMKNGPRPTNSARPILYISKMAPPTRDGPATPTPMNHSARVLADCS